MVSIILNTPSIINPIFSGK